MSVARYYLPAAQNLSGLQIGRSPMPIATLQSYPTLEATMANASLVSDTAAVVTLSTFTFGNGSAASETIIRYTLDGSAPSQSAGKLYSAGERLRVGTGARLRAVSEQTGLAPSRELNFIAPLSH